MGSRFALPIIATAISSLAGAAPLHTSGAFLEDAGGGVVLLRGVNVAGNSKVPPFEPITSGAFLDPLPGWGFNAIRLLFTWEAFEPERGVYQESYLAYYEQAVRWAEERNLSVIVDFHQDAYSRFSIGGCGEGFPPWAVTPMVSLALPNNGAACSSWGTSMIFDLSHHQTWAQFHDDSDGAQTAYLAMVGTVAARLASRPNVIGYELMNEPWGTDAELHALFEKVAQRIRAQHPDAVLFVPPHALVSSGMPDNNIARPTFENFVYAPHYYDPFVVMLNAWLGSDPASPLDRMRAKAASWASPMVLTEFGAQPDGWNIPGYMEAQAAWLDNRWVSSVQWNYTPGWRDDTKDGWNAENLSIVDGAGHRRANFVPRPYPQRTAGIPISFTRDGAGFSFSWENSPAAGETVVYLPEHYADGLRVHATWPTGVAGRCTLSAQSLRCTANGRGVVSLALR